MCHVLVTWSAQVTCQSIPCTNVILKEGGVADVGDELTVVVDTALSLGRQGLFQELL